MQSYVYLITISATVVIGWIALELLGRPIRALFDLRGKILKQLVMHGNIPLPKPRESAVSSREIREYDRAVKRVRAVQHIFHDLGSQLLAFAENEPAVSTAIGFFGLNAVAAGRALISLSESYSRPRIDRVSLQHRIERALRASCEATTPVRQPRRDTIIKFQTEPMYLRDIGLFT